jgi:two-component system, OmpR family, phosphate regulon sensor histidine kinase PhoR
VDDVLNISRLEQGRSRLANEDQVNLVLLVQSVWHSIEPLAKLRQLELSYQGPEQLIANVNASLMHRVLFNLLSNAVKYSPPHQVIQVKLSVTASQKALNGNTAEGTIIDPVLAEGLSGECILLEVIDAGTGLNEQDLPYVFDRFYRADPARSHEVSLDMPDSASVNSIEMAELSSSGTGLGLAIVRQIVASHQGRVEAKNSPDTGGAWLRVWLPGKRLVKTMV